MPVTWIGAPGVCPNVLVAATIAGSEHNSSRRESGSVMSSPVNHEFEQVAVRVADVGARALRLTSALPRDRTLFDARARGVEPGFELRGRAVPDETQIATRRLRRRRTQRER